MDINIFNEIVDVSHKKVFYSMKIYNPQKILVSSEFWLQSIYQPDEFILKKCGVRIYLKNLIFDKYYSEAIQHMFQYLRQFASEFCFRNIDTKLQNKIVLEVGYPVLAQEVLPLLSHCKNLRMHILEKDSHVSDESLNRNFIFMEGVFERLDSLQSFHISASSNRQNISELNSARKNFIDAENSILAMLASPIPFLDGNGSDTFFEKHGYYSSLSANKLQNYLTQIKNIKTDFYSVIENRPCNSVSFSLAE